MQSSNGSDQAALGYTLKFNPPMDHTVGERNLREAKDILDGLGMVFLLGSGTCLGATRDKAFIPWDDDIDLVAVVGVNGLTEDSADLAAAAFRNRGYFVGEIDGAHSKTLMTMKDHVRLSFECLQIVGDSIYAYPGMQLPAKLFTQPKEIEFLGQKFFVPNPPEEYLRLKYGEEWMTPKRAGEYEKDVVDKIPAVDLVGQPGWIKVLDVEGIAISGAEVVLVAGGRSTTDVKGYAEIILPGLDWYALIIKYPGHKQVLYMEELEPGKSYVYKTGAASNVATDSQVAIGTVGNVLVPD